MKKIKWLLVAVFCMVLGMGMSVGAYVVEDESPRIISITCNVKNGDILGYGDTIQISFKYEGKYTFKGSSARIYPLYDWSVPSTEQKLKFTTTYDEQTKICTLSSNGLTSDMLEGKCYIQNIYVSDVNGNSYTENPHISFTFNNNCKLGKHVSKDYRDGGGCFEYFTCKYCDTVLGEKEHTNPSRETYRIDPTCTQSGKIIDQCPTCGYIYETKTIPALGHNYTWENSTRSNAFDGNMRTQRCLRCGASGKTESLSYTVKPRTLKVGGDVYIHASDFGASGSQYKLVKYHSSNSRIATVSKKGKVVAKKVGSCYIRVTAKNGKTAKIKIQVKPTNTKKITFTKKSVTLKEGKTLTLKYKRYPAKANDKLTWKSSKPKIVKVTSKGKVKALKKGKSTITVKAASGKSARITIRVK